MANAEELYETMDVILANLDSWDQDTFASNTDEFKSFSPIGECGTTQCIAGFRGLMDGLLPTYIEDIYVDPLTGRDVSIDAYAAERFGLTYNEMIALFYFCTDDPAELRQRIDEIVAGEWR